MDYLRNIKNAITLAYRSQTIFIDWWHFSEHTFHNYIILDSRNNVNNNRYKMIIKSIITFLSVLLWRICCGLRELDADQRRKRTYEASPLSTNSGWVKVYRRFGWMVYFIATAMNSPATYLLRLQLFTITCESVVRPLVYIFITNRWINWIWV